MSVFAESKPKTTFVWYRHYEEFDDYPLVKEVGVVISIVIIYLLFVKIIGPGFMKNRQPYALKTPLLLFNAVQVVLSLFYIILFLRPFFYVGLLPRTTPQQDPKIRKMMFIAVYSYFLGRVIDMLDTVFFVLRKKYNQITFLHVYHHASVVIGTWGMLVYSLDQSGLFAFSLNSVVHVVMYFYYFMAALGPQYQKYLTWKKYVTTFQLVQFAAQFTFQIISIFYTKGEHVVLGIIYKLSATILFFTLFSDFYTTSYEKKPERASIHSHKNGVLETDNKKTG